jgi:diadenylate cyclase
VEFLWALQTIDLAALVDILIVAGFFFSLSFLVRGTQAVALVRGTLIILVSLILLSSVLQLQALRFLLGQLLTVLLVAVPVVFQPEIRRILERLGRGNLFGDRAAPQSARAKVIDEVCQAAERLAERRHGALIVLQRENTLMEYVRTGIALDSQVSAQLLLTVFWPKTELHDGAAIIDRAGRIASAAAVLPLTASRNLPSRKMGTRHRAALGISEVSDALCIVVSEETGKIAITNGGRMVSRVDPERLRTILRAFYIPEPTGAKSTLLRLREGMQTLAERAGVRLNGRAKQS